MAGIRDMPDTNDSSGRDAGDNDRTGRRTKCDNRPRSQPQPEIQPNRIRGFHLRDPAEDDPVWAVALAAARKDRDKRYSRFRERQEALGTRGAVSLAELVDAYVKARCPSLQPPELVEKHRQDAYRDLERDLFGRRRFKKGERLSVLYFNPHPLVPIQCLTVEALREYRQALPREVIWNQVLNHCWVAPRHAREWLEAQQKPTQAMWPEETTDPPPAVAPADTPVVASTDLPPAAPPIGQPQAPAPGPDPRTLPPPGKRRGGLDFSEDDVPLVKRLVEGLQAKPPLYSGPLERCMELAPEAKGMKKTSVVSKAHRLLRRYHAYSADSSDSRSNK
jgi:hypothetical protein